jgi:hypothetical protein
MTTVVHKHKEEFDVYIGRPSKWGNPFTHHAEKDTLAEFVVKTRKEAIEKYEEWILFGEGKYLLNDIHELKDKRLGCWCKPKSCHGDILSRIANQLNHTENKFF